MSALLIPLLAFVDDPVAVPVASALAMRYYRSGVAIWWISQLWTLSIPLLLLVTGTSARLRSTAQRITGRRWLATGLYGVMYVTLFSVASLPFAFYTGYMRPHEYGLAASTYTPLVWLADEVKELAVSALMAFVLIIPAYNALRRLPRSWPIAITLGYIPISFALMFLAPIVVDPMFDHFGPMKDATLEAKIRNLADRAGIEGGRIYEVDKSKRSKAINAYVKGFLGSKRIVLYDTLIQKLDERQVLFVMGHEMGHYVLGHVARSMLLGTIGVLALTLFLRSAGLAMVSRFGNRFGFLTLDDVASLPLFLLLGNLFVLTASPIGLAYSRYQEHEADRFALELTHDNHAGASSFVTMQQENLSNPRPGPLSVLWRSTHPSLAERIEFCNAYRPWASGGTRSYESRFRDP